MIAIDWGSSSLRAYRLDDGGRVRERRRAGIGALGHDGRHADLIGAHIAGWDDAQIVLCGAVGGRGGWIEVPYVECPARAAAIAAALARVDTRDSVLRARSVSIVPGVADHRSSPIADVMRGEETQIVGLLAACAEADFVVCLPGTHGKWVGVRDRAIAGIRTALTGEAYALFRRHSVLARTMPAGADAFDPAAFDAGLRRSGDAGGLLHHLFGVRTQTLFGELAAEQAPSCLSGLLIGHDIRAQLPLPPRLHLIAGEQLAQAYARAFAAFDVEVIAHDEDLAAAGMRALLRRAHE